MPNSETLMIDCMLSTIDTEIAHVLERALCDKEINASEAAVLYRAEGRGFFTLLMAADELRRKSVGNRVSYVHNRNINFTNICVGGCLFCAFHRTRADDPDAYLMTTDRIVEKAEEAAQDGATEVCIQGGLNRAVSPDYYLQICESVKEHRVVSKRYD